MIISHFVHLIKQHSKRKKWRMKNSHNLTSMGMVFDSSLVSVGKKTYGELNVINYSKSRQLIIGNYVSVGPEVLFIVCGDHPTNHISSYPFKVRFKKQQFEATSKGDIIIGDDVWIGARSTILSGVSIGQGAIVAAGTVVAKSIPPYAIVGGVPAKIIKYRFTEDIIEQMKRINYAKISDDFIIQNIDSFYADPIDLEFLQKLPLD